VCWREEAQIFISDPTPKLTNEKAKNKTSEKKKRKKGCKRNKKRREQITLPS
jgi:prophage tail gpP-like protein